MLFLALAHAASQIPQGAILVPAAAEGQSWVNIISQTGFPIAVSIYLLWQQDKRLNKISSTLDRQTEILRIRPPENEDSA